MHWYTNSKSVRSHWSPNNRWNNVYTTWGKKGHLPGKNTHTNTAEKTGHTRLNAAFDNCKRSLAAGTSLCAFGGDATNSCELKPLMDRENNREVINCLKRDSLNNHDNICRTQTHTAGREENHPNNRVFTEHRPSRLCVSRGLLTSDAFNVGSTRLTESNLLTERKIHNTTASFTPLGQQSRGRRRSGTMKG